MYNTNSESSCKQWSLGDNDVFFLKSQRMGIIYQANINQKNAAVTIFILHEVDFVKRNIARDIVMHNNDKIIHLRREIIPNMYALKIDPKNT
jgi:ABC-type phosphate/phosphonate transport system ATPase subunit